MEQLAKIYAIVVISAWVLGTIGAILALWKIHDLLMQLF